MNVRPFFNRLLPLGLALGLGASIAACDDGAKNAKADAKPQADAKADAKSDAKADAKAEVEPEKKPEEAAAEAGEAKPEEEKKDEPKAKDPKPKKEPKPKKDEPKPAAAAPSGVDGKAVYLKKCKNCHGVTGNADTKIGKKNDIPSWKEPGWKGKWSLSKVKDITKNGKSGTKMKPFKSKLTADEIDAVSAYARGLGK